MLTQFFSSYGGHGTTQMLLLRKDGLVRQLAPLCGSLHSLPHSLFCYGCVFILDQSKNSELTDKWIGFQHQPGKQEGLVWLLECLTHYCSDVHSSNDRANVSVSEHH